MQFSVDETSFLYKLAVFAVILLGTGIVVEIARRLIEKTLQPSMPYVEKYIKRYTTWFIWVIGVTFGIRQVGLSIEVILLVIGLAGVGFLVAARDVLPSMLARHFLDLYSQYKLGDHISIGSHHGDVIEITSLNTVIRKGKNIVVIPNYLFLREPWVNQSTKSGYEVSVPVRVGNELDLVEFEERLVESLKGVESYILSPPTVVTIKSDEKQTEMAVILSLKKPEDKTVVVSEINEMVKKIIDEMLESAESE